MTSSCFGWSAVVLAAAAAVTAAHAGSPVYEAAILADAPVAYFPFDETDGPMAADASGNGNDGTTTGSIGFGADTAEPNLGTAFDFDGGYVDVPNLGTFPQSSVEVWMQIDGLAAGCCTSIMSTDPWATGALHFNLKSGRTIEHAVNSGAPNNVNTVGFTLQNGVWHHLVVTHDSTIGETRFFIDGVEVADDGDHTAQDVVFGNNNLQIGAWNGTRLFDGRMDEFAIYDSILTPERVQAHYEAASAADPSGLSFAITGITRAPEGDEVTITWNSLPNHLYRTEASPDLIDWVELDDGIVSEGMQTSFTDTAIPPDVPVRFYRVGDLGVAP